jgi:hypothetical protein
LDKLIRRYAEEWLHIGILSKVVRSCCSICGIIRIIENQKKKKKKKKKGKEPKIHQSTRKVDVLVAAYAARNKPPDSQPTLQTAPHGMG